MPLPFCSPVAVLYPLIPPAYSTILPQYPHVLCIVQPHSTSLPISALPSSSSAASSQSHVFMPTFLMQLPYFCAQISSLSLCPSQCVRPQKCVETYKYLPPLKNRPKASQIRCPSWGGTSEMGLKLACPWWPNLTALGPVLTNSRHHTALHWAWHSPFFSHLPSSF